MYCYETFKVEEITIKKAEVNVVFNATKKFEENKFSEYCLKMPNSYEQLLNGNFRGMYCCETFKVEEITI